MLKISASFGSNHLKNINQQERIISCSHKYHNYSIAKNYIATGLVLEKSNSYTTLIFLKVL
jgi:hypothetical protein